MPVHPLRKVTQQLAGQLGTAGSSLEQLTAAWNSWQQLGTAVSSLEQLSAVRSCCKQLAPDGSSRQQLDAAADKALQQLATLAAACRTMLLNIITSHNIV